MVGIDGCRRLLNVVKDGIAISKNQIRQVGPKYRSFATHDVAGDTSTVTKEHAASAQPASLNITASPGNGRIRHSRGRLRSPRHAHEGGRQPVMTVSIRKKPAVRRRLRVSHIARG